jgi:hypothetical protein
MLGLYKDAEILKSLPSRCIYKEFDNLEEAERYLNSEKKVFNVPIQIPNAHKNIYEYAFVSFKADPHWKESIQEYGQKGYCIVTTVGEETIVLEKGNN